MELIEVMKKDGVLKRSKFMFYLGREWSQPLTGGGCPDACCCGCQWPDRRLWCVGCLLLWHHALLRAYKYSNLT